MAENSISHLVAWLCRATHLSEALPRETWDIAADVDRGTGGRATRMHSQAEPGNEIGSLKRFSNFKPFSVPFVSPW